MEHMIGRTIIELTDVHTGEVKRYEDHNAFMDDNLKAKTRNFGIFQTSVLENFASGCPLFDKLLLFYHKVGKITSEKHKKRGALAPLAHQWADSSSSRSSGRKISEMHQTPAKATTV